MIALICKICTHCTCTRLPRGISLLVTLHGYQMQLMERYGFCLKELDNMSFLGLPFPCNYFHEFRVLHLRMSVSPYIQTPADKHPCTRSWLTVS